MTDYTIGILILAASMAVIVWMLAVSYKLIAESAIEEAREEAKKDARLMAQWKYQQMLKSTKVRIKQTMRITNDTDIPWQSERRDSCEQTG